MKYLLVLTAFLYSVMHCNAQCEENQIEVSITVYTDNWGYETYWQLLPSGNDCGTDVIFEASNLGVGCDGGGEQDADGSGYENNTTYEEGPFCLDVDSAYDIIFVDDWGDGGLTFEVEQDGIVTNYLVGGGQGNTFTFTAGDLTPAFVPGDRVCEALSIEVDGDSLLVDNTEATVFPGEPAPILIGCAVYGGWCDSNGGASNTMWVSFTAPDEGQLEISTCNDDTNFDSAIAVYEVGDCSDFNTFNLVSSNDDAYGGCPNGNGFAGVCYASCLTPGEEYYIMVEGWAGATGVAELTVTTVDVEEVINGFVRDVACANIKGETGSRIIPQVVGLGINYDISWSGPFDFSSDEWILENVPAGDYTCTITNACGYSDEATFTVDQPSAVSTEFNVTNTSCMGAGNGELSVEATGGTGEYQYSWTGPDEFAAFEAELDSLAEGTYFLEITDENDCVYNSAISLDTEDILEFSLGEDEVICMNQFILFESPIGFYTYEWQDGSVNSTYTFSGPDSGVGNYNVSLTILNDEGCTYTDVVSVEVENCVGIEENHVQFNVYPNPVSEELTINLVGFSGLESTVFVLRNSLGQEVYASQWSSSELHIDVSNFSAGVYSLSALQGEKTLFTEKVIIK